CAQVTEYRKLDGKIWNPEKSRQWTNVHGRVSKVLPDGIIAGHVKQIRGSANVSSMTRVGQLGGGRTVYGPVVGSEITSHFYLGGAPNRIRVDDAEFTLRVFRRGITNLNGSVIEAYDFGEIATPVDVAAEFTARRDESRKLQDALDAANLAREKMLVPNVISSQLRSASNGLPYAQLELGKRYLRGDGVETNLTLARHWLTAACTNGESQASNLLRQINFQDASK
ncbi:MAG TPA: SEL1-like repeat protein, partial [Methylomirabilota bacterium]|nr:SEL1-like repeat protein [Methylomirabilota bacterium]